MDYFTSDEHFDHFKIIEYCNRPFSSVHEMNNFMIEQWNSVVNDTSAVYVLGDFALTSIERIFHILKSLKGTKILIKGNHDRHTVKKYIEAGFQRVFQELNYVWKHDDVLWDFKMCHRPMYKKEEEFSEQVPIKWNLCGHVHDRWKINREHQILNVGVDQWNYTPITITEIIKEISKHNLSRHENNLSGP